MPNDEDWEKDFEPGSRAYDIGLQPLVSIAISLKRLADSWGKDNPRTISDEDKF